MSSRLVASGQGRCGGASSSRPGFWEPSISETLLQSSASFFLDICGAKLQHPWLPVLLGEGRGWGERKPSMALGPGASTGTWVILSS